MIFHSYVKLPEGISFHSGPGLSVGAHHRSRPPPLAAPRPCRRHVELAAAGGDAGDGGCDWVTPGDWVTSAYQPSKPGIPVKSWDEPVLINIIRSKGWIFFSATRNSTSPVLSSRFADDVLHKIYSPSALTKETRVNCGETSQ